MCVWSVGGGGLRHPSSGHMLHMLLSGSAMCGLSSGLSHTEREKQLRMDGWSLQTRGQQPGGERKQRGRGQERERGESSLGWTIRGRSWACREDSDQLIVLLHLPRVLINSGVCLFQ